MPVVLQAERVFSFVTLQTRRVSPTSGGRAAQLRMNGSFQAALSLEGAQSPRLLTLVSAESSVPPADLAQNGFSGAETS